jgi:hypothetical protein
VLISGVFLMFFGLFHGAESPFDGEEEPDIKAFRKASGGAMIVGGALAAGGGSVLWYPADRKKRSN